MSNEKWSNWIEWSGGKCPLPDGVMHEVQYRTGERCIDDLPETSYWGSDGDDCDITAYRYRLADEEQAHSKAAEDMHPELKELAERLTKWPSNAYWAACLESREGMQCYGWPENLKPECYTVFTYPQWLQARKDLGFDVKPSTDEVCNFPNCGCPIDKTSVCVRGLPDALTVQEYAKQPRYQDAAGADWIDEFARTATTEEFRGAMRFTLGKYNRRVGKKDEIVKEIEKMEDYCRRWKEYELNG